VRVQGKGLPTAKIGDSSELKTGQLAVAIGSPLGAFTNSVTTGVVSALGRDIQVDDDCSHSGHEALHNLIQTDAAINPGNSGGALVASVGAVTAITPAPEGDARGMGFAPPINTPKPLMDRGEGGKPLVRPWLGIESQPVTLSIVQSQHLPID